MEGTLQSGFLLALLVCKSLTNYGNYISFGFCSLYYIFDYIPELGVARWFYYRFYLSEDFIFFFPTMTFSVASLAWWVKMLQLFLMVGQPFMSYSFIQGCCFQVSAPGFHKVSFCLCAQIGTLTPTYLCPRSLPLLAILAPFNLLLYYNSFSGIWGCSSLSFSLTQLSFFLSVSPCDSIKTVIFYQVLLHVLIKCADVKVGS